MIGGAVIETYFDDEPPPTVVVVARNGKDEGAVQCERNALSERIALGDRVWWGHGKVFWTSQDEEFVDVPFKKIGPGVTPPRPE